MSNLFHKIALPLAAFACLLSVNETVGLSQQKKSAAKKKTAVAANKVSNDNFNPAAVGCKGITAPVKIISRPRAVPSNEALRAMQLSGTVRVRVMFLDSGQIGQVTPINSLPYGLTESSVEAARKIKFIPAMKCGVPVSSHKVVEYNFNLY